MIFSLAKAEGLVNSLRAGSEDLVDLLLSFVLAETLLLGDDLNESVTVACSTGEVFCGELVELSSEGCSCLFDTHVDGDVGLYDGLTNCCTVRLLQLLEHCSLGS